MTTEITHILTQPAGVALGEVVLNSVEFNSDTVQRIVETMAQAKIEDQVKKYLDTPRKQSASATLSSIFGALIFNIQNNFPDWEKGFTSATATLGIIANYCTDNPLLPKPPFSDSDNKWNLTEEAIAKIKESLTPEKIAIAQNFIYQTPSEISTNDPRFTPEQLYTAIAYLKVKPHLHQSQTQPEIPK